MKIAVGGCSFSDYRYDILPYGQQVAEYFGFEYIHAAACAGSNHRIWRVLTKAIIDKKLTSGDIILLQYTILDRKEIWSPTSKRYKSPYETLDDEWEDGKLFRLTVHSDSLAKSADEIKISKLHNKFTNYNYNKEVFLTQHVMFDALCKQNNIHLFNINTQYDKDHRIQGIELDHILEHDHLRLDSAHMNNDGHRVATAKIVDFLDQAIDAS